MRWKGGTGSQEGVENMKSMEANLETKKLSIFLVALSYVRSIFSTILAFLWTVGYGSMAIFVLSIYPRQSWRDFIYRTWGKGCVGLFGVEVELRGAPHFPAPGSPGAICLFNHTSNFDIPVVNSVLRGSVRWGAKIELFKIPIFGSILRAMGVLPIARNHREEVLKVYSETIPRVKGGECFLLAPEGTRKDGSQIFPFKSGPFIFAIEAQCPLLPVVIYGAWKVQSRGQLFPTWGQWRNRVIVQVLPPISTLGLSLADRMSIQDRAFQQMTEAFDHLKDEVESESTST